MIFIALYLPPLTWSTFLFLTLAAQALAIRAAVNASLALWGVTRWDIRKAVYTGLIEPNKPSIDAPQVIVNKACSTLTHYIAPTAQSSKEGTPQPHDTKAVKAMRLSPTPIIICTALWIAAAILSIKGSSGATTVLIQLTIVLILVGLYQVLTFFKKMYETSKWTTEASRFSKILVQAFWALEIGTYSVFTYLMSIRPELNVYGFGNATALAVSRLEVIELLSSMGMFVAITLPLIVGSLVKKGQNREILLGLLTVAILTVSKLSHTEIGDVQVSYTWLQEHKLKISEAASEISIAQPTSMLDVVSEGAQIAQTSTTWVEVLHEQKTKIFYSIILTSLKALHSVFVLALLLIVAIQYVRTSDMSYHIVSVLVLNSMFLCVFGLLAHLPEVIQEVSVFETLSSASYDSTIPNTKAHRITLAQLK